MDDFKELREAPFTPGPWVIGERDGYGLNYVTTEHRMVFNYAEIATVETGWDGPFEAEQQANLRLIAAAPAMLARIDELTRERDEARAQVEALRNASQWQPIETAPKDGRKIIVRYLNRNGLNRTVFASWLTDEEAAESDADGVGLEGGWYERIDNWSDFTQVAIHEGEPTHWMPLPAAPADAAKEQRNV